MLNSVITISAIVFVVVVNYLLLSTQNIIILFAVFSATYIAGYLALSSSKRRVAQRVRFFATLFLFLFVFHVIFNRNSSLYTHFNSSLKTVLQIASISEMMLVLTGKISMSKFINGLFFLPQSMKMLITITFSFIPFLVEEQQKISLVQKSRGMGTTLQSKFTGIFSTIIPLIHRLFRRSEDLALVIDMRGGNPYGDNS